MAAMGITLTNDEALTSEYGTLFWKQTPASYSVMPSGPFCLWTKSVGFSTSDVLSARLLPVEGAGATIDFSSQAWTVPAYRRAHSGYWYSRWLPAGLVDGVTYRMQYRWNDEAWQDGPGANLVAVDDSRQAVFLSRFSPGYTNAPSAPAWLAAAEGSGVGRVRLMWAVSTGVLHYEVVRARAGEPGDGERLVETSNTGYDDAAAEAGVRYRYRVRAVNPAGASAFSGWEQGWARGRRAACDYDGDGRSDWAVFDFTTGGWYVRSATGATLAWAEAWGWPGAVPVEGDYNGDGAADLAVFDSLAGCWYVRSLAAGVLAWAAPWGWPGAAPVSGDYDGDGMDDLAVFDMTTGGWYVRSAAGATLVWAEDWGWPGAMPVSGDYDGDGENDLAVFDGATGCWYARTVAGAVRFWADAWGWPGAWPIHGAPCR